MLSPYRVLDLTNQRGHLCGQILADLGADVIMIEPPGGSPSRTRGPFIGNRAEPERSLTWAAYNRNKRGITLDIETSAGQAILRRLVESANFLIESDTPGAFAERELGYDDLRKINPGLVMVSISAFGQEGPKAHYADTDLIVLAAGGPLALSGDDDRPPLRISVPQAYLHAGGAAAAAALIAHHYRARTGLGQHVDVSAQQAVAQATLSVLLAVPLLDLEPQRKTGGLRIGPIDVRFVWPARDGYIAMAFGGGSALHAFTQRLMNWAYEEGYCDSATRDKDWLRYVEMLMTGEETEEEHARVQAVVENFTRSKSKAELLTGALERGLMIAPVSTMDEVVNEAQFEARDYWRTIADDRAQAGAFRVPGPFAKFSRTPIEYRLPPPRIGEHNAAILGAELGHSSAELAALAAEGVI